jgi:hydroxypyruvate isomerase
MDHPGCPFWSTADVLALVFSVNRPKLKINLDLHHAQIGERDLLRWREKCLSRIGEVHVAQNPGRLEPGTGEINCAGGARGLNKMGYSGPVALDAYASADADSALEAFRTTFTLGTEQGHVSRCPLVEDIRKMKERTNRPDSHDHRETYRGLTS